MPGDLQSVFGRALKEERLRRGISQEDWADFLGMHRTRAGAIERGEKNLTLRSVERIAARVGVDPVVLLGGRPAYDEVELRAAHEGDDPGSAGGTDRR